MSLTVIEEYIGTFCNECNEEVSDSGFVCSECGTDDYIEDRSIKVCSVCGEESEVFWDEIECPQCNN